MGLENLKSAFSNIETPSPSIPKKQGAEVTSIAQTDVSTMSTQLHSVSNIEFSNQKSDGNDYMFALHKVTVPGFTSNFTDRGSGLGTSKFIGIDSDYDNPGAKASSWPILAKHIADDVVNTTKSFFSGKGLLFIIKENLMGTFQKYKPWYSPTSTIANVAFPKEGFILPLFSVPRDFPFKSIFGDLSSDTPYSDYITKRENLSEMKDPIIPLGNSFPEDSPKMGSDKERESTMAIGNYNRRNVPLAYKANLNVGGFEILKGLKDKISKQLSKVDHQDDLLDFFTKTKESTTGPNIQTSMDATIEKPVGKGDFHTLITISNPNKFNKTLSDAFGTSGAELVESPKHGMPFYFQDLRDNAFIIFRAYIDGISDTISPNWSPETYIGRSEPVYTYTNAERELSFNLSLFAQTSNELDMIYIKMNRLTSLCYPEYTTIEETLFTDSDASQDVTFGKSLDKVRMKPPIVKFRLGELFGSSKKEMVGFIKSLSYTFPDESPWEIDKGRRVPKYVTANIGFQVMHSTVPSLDFARKKDGESDPLNTFYGINQHVGVQ